LRIAQVVASYYPRVGGVETHVRCLAEGCARAGDEVTVLTHHAGGSPADEHAGGVRVRRFPLTVTAPNYPISVRLFRHLRARARDFDVVHVHSYHTLVGHAAGGTGLPMVFTPHYHGTGHTPLRAALHHLYRPLGARLFTMADAVICVSDAERDLVIRDFALPPAKVTTIPNGTGARTPAARKACGGRAGPVVLTVGRLERYKNVDLIIGAFKALTSPATLVVVGDGPDRRRLERLAGAASPQRPVLFTGQVPEGVLDQLFAEADVVASASDHEAFGLTLAQGLASGARVVASAIPAHAALTRLAGPGAPVALTDPRDPERFTDLLAASLRAGRTTPGSFRLPSWADVVEHTRELYAQVRLQRYLAH
jgi:1,2-diacylglycerol 3-alpha-glucosyltransferase